MVIFKTFLRILNKCKLPIIFYTILLLFFAGINMSSNDTSMDFTAEKPAIMVINNDVDDGITKNFIEYLHENTDVKDIKNDEQAIKDALFYRDVQYIIYIPENFSQNFLDGENPQIDIKSTGEYQSVLANMIVERYIKVAKNYRASAISEDELFEKIDETLSKKANVQITSKLDTNSMNRLTKYFNFSAYSFIAISIYVICLIMLIFKDEKINKRTAIGSIDYKKINIKLLIANSVFCFIVWLIYLIIARALIGEVALSIHGIYFAINSLIFVISTVALAFLIGNIIKNKNTISAFVNIIGLGSSFLCGAFVPMEFIPDFVLKIAHILPAYWFIKNNELIGSTESFTGDVVKDMVINMAVLVGFSLVFIIATNIVSKRNIKRTD